MKNLPVCSVDCFILDVYSGNPECCERCIDVVNMLVRECAHVFAVDHSPCQGRYEYDCEGCRYPGCAGQYPFSDTTY